MAITQALPMMETKGKVELHGSLSACRILCGKYYFH